MHRSRVFLVLCIASGCAARGDVELLESRLREQEDEVRRLSAQLHQAETRLDSARAEAEMLRMQLANRGEQSLLPEQASALFRATGIRFHPFLTAGVDRDGNSGHDLVATTVIPHDADGSAVKVAGNLVMRLVDPSRTDGQTTVGEWSYSPQDLRRAWQEGLFGAGFQLELELNGEADADQLVLHAEFTTSDGRKFEATRLVPLTRPQWTAIDEVSTRN